jgi:SprT protein
MLSHRQLEFAASVVARSNPRHLDLARTNSAGIIDPGYDGVNCNIALRTKARQLLRANGAARIASEVRVEWNTRLKTCAGRADYRQKLIMLNPELVCHPNEVDRTLRHELAHFLAQFREKSRRRIKPHGSEWREACRDLGIGGEKRCHNLPFAATNSKKRFLYRCPKCWRDFPRVRRIRRAIACLACCRAHNRGKFDSRFQLRITTKV